MAGALVGGAFLSASLQILFDRIASRQVAAFFRGQNHNDRLLKKLNTRMISVSALLDDAEEKRITNPAVQKWLDQLKDAVYEVDDFLDEIAYEALRLELKAEDQTFTGQVQNFISFLNPCKMGLREIEEKLEELLEDLDDLVKQKDVLGLINRIGENPSSHKTPTTSLVDEFGVYGRDDDKKAITKLLLSDDANGKNPGVIPVVGMGGVGKTTLAQLVYNHGKVKEWFDVKAWICVSEDFDVFKLTKDILKEVHPGITDAKTLNQLQHRLMDTLRGKKFLLVLDDVWNDNYADWDMLFTPLKSGAQGSKILVTTRNESVASVMQTVPTHHLKEITEDSCWLLFAKHAFGDENLNAPSELQAIGRAIVRKCKGLPLAAKTLGGLLRTKRDSKEWEKILESNLWDLPNDSILPALRLSYHYLPSHLKQCFAYCAIFPKDYTFGKDELVLLWMAEGFIVQSGNDEMEAAGDEYFHDLLSRSLFQQSSASPTLFVMHDLINDLATHVSGQFCFRLEGNDSHNTSTRTRHLSLEETKCEFSSTKFENIREAQHVRTFHNFPHQWRSSIISNELLHILATLGRLRVLSLSKCRGAAKVFNSTGKLKHLRYLHLSGSSIEKLPEVVSTLHNLQTLILKDCYRLARLPDFGNLKHLRHLNLQNTQIRRLPDFGNLKHLRHLNLQNTQIRRLPASMGRLINLRYLNISDTPLKEMPPRMGQLTKLQTLTGFAVGKHSGSTIKVLGQLQHLRGQLHIWNLQNVVDARDVVVANLKGKEHLEELELRWDGGTHDSQREKGILEKLEPHRNVKSVSIVGYGGTGYPDWVGDCSFSNIVSLNLRGSTNCSSLPPLGQLASLKDLLIERFDNVVTVGSEFYGNCTDMKKPFESLKTLRFEVMPQWREWISDEGRREAFPLLEELYISHCPHLTKALPSHLPCLKELEIRKCGQLVTPFPRYPIINDIKLLDDSGWLYLEKLPSGLHRLVSEFHSQESLLKEIEQMGSSPTDLGEIVIQSWAFLKCLPLELFPKLSSLFIHSCPDLESLCAHGRPLDDLTSLLYLRIVRCPKLVSFPKGGLPAPVLTNLELRDCTNLKLLPESMHSLLPSLVDLQIDGCSELELFPEGGLPSKLQSLQIRRFDKLIAGRMQWGLQTPPSLSEFTIAYNKKVESFPEEMLLPSSLTSLAICHLKNLKSLDYKGLQHLTSLRRLDIRRCPKLESMPKEGLPSSLSSLEIYRCPLLKKRCEREKGKDWPKISHIQEIIIDGRQM